MTASQIIAQLGGYAEVARQLSVPVTTVHSWHRRNAIPDWRQSALLQLALEKGVTLSTADFPAKVAA